MAKSDRTMACKRRAQSKGLRLRVRRAALALACSSGVALGSENVPHRPFAEWADLPAPGQFIAGAVYEESEAYHIYVHGVSQNVTWHAGGESYGIDINQGYIALQYGIAPRWAADLNIGATTVGWRYFDNGGIQSTIGLMDYSFGIRYQIFNEATNNSPWLPTLTFRAGAVLPGSYNQNFAFAPGVRSAAIEPELLARKHFGWPGLGAYADALYRWNRTTGNDQYLAVIGLFQQIKGWELDVGYRHLQTLSGGDISFDPADPASLVYPRDVREINDGIEAGFSYTTAKSHIRYGFESLTIFDGNNTDRKFWVGGSIDIPFSLRQRK
jgi:hypothetical protein